jgi:RND family efflux transporter MFP subunit
VIIAGLLVAGCGGEKSAPEPELRPVRYQPVYATGGTRVRTFSGTAQASIEARLSFKVAGTVQRKLVQVGDKVKAGQLLASLDPRDYELQKQQAEAALNQAQAEARNASANYERVRTLYENKNASLNDLDAARAATESANAAVDAREKQLEMTQLTLDYTELRASTDGSIAEVSCDVNENVGAGQSVITLTAGSRVKIQVAVPEILIGQIREGDRVAVTLDAIPDRTFPARVTEVGVASTGFVTTFPVAVVLDTEDPDVRPGMAAEVAFTFASQDTRERFIVPPVAVAEDREGRFVFVVKDAGDGVGVVERRPVTVGELTADGLEVFTGLFEGDLLVTAGVSRLADGQRVKFEPAAGDRTETGS